jgi:hypothetical protein
VLGDDCSEAIEDFANRLMEFLLAWIAAENVVENRLELFIEHLIFHL